MCIMNLFWAVERFFHLASKLKEAHLSDINAELINTYKNVKANVNELISVLSKIEKNYLSLDSDGRKIKYYDLRDEYNSLSTLNVRKAALFIALNKTCFNGLFRVNSSNKFNVPQGSYKNPKICDKESLLNASKLLRLASIEHKQYYDVTPTKNSFMYLDPPYRPLSKTASFNSYSNDVFDDTSQIKLANYCKSLQNNFILSNSDLKNTNVNDNFFDDLYNGFDIIRVSAKRMISAKGDRGKINELIIRNFSND